MVNTTLDILDINVRACTSSQKYTIPLIQFISLLMIFIFFICYFSSNKSLADSLDECVDPQDPNFNKVPNCKRVTIFLLFIVIHASL